MSSTLELRLRSPWGRLAFALIWVGLLSVAWPYIKSSAPLQSLTAAGARHDFVVALLISATVYLSTIVAVLYMGVAVYLAAIRQFKLRNLLRGFVALFVVLLVAHGILSFARVAQLSDAAEYVLTWLPMYVALFCALKFAVPSTRSVPITRAVASS